MNIRRKTRLPLLLLAAALCFLIVCPLIMIFAKAVITDGRLDFYCAWQTLTESENAVMIGNSLLLGVLVVLLSTLIAAPLAYLFSRTCFARYRAFDIIFMIPFMTPPYIASMGWILFMQKRGLLQQLFPGAAGCENWFFSLGGLVLVMSLHVFPFMLTMLKNAMLNIPSSLEESGAVFGAGFWQRMRKIFLPLLSGNYAIGALLVFVKTISEYGTPSTLGKRIGFEVFTTEIHRYATVAPIAFGKSAALASVLVGICLGMWMLQNYITTRKSYRLVSGKGSRFTEVKLSKPVKALCCGYIAAVLLLSIGVPYFSVISTSLIKLRGYGFTKGNFTFQHYIDLFTENTKGIHALSNSLLLAVSSATICAALGTIIVLAVHSSRSKLRKVVEAMSLLPEMLPGIVLVIGIMLFWNQIYHVLPLYNTLGIMVLVKFTVTHVLTDTAIDRIADAIVVMQEQEDTMTPVLKQQLQQCETEIRNVMKAIRQGIITETTKECLEDLETQRDSLKASIAQLALERRKFTKEEIVDWISQYKNGNINDPDYRRELIDTFVNSVYVYDDKLLLTYNYRDGSQTLTLKEIEAALSSDLTSMCPPVEKTTPAGCGFLLVAQDSNQSVATPRRGVAARRLDDGRSIMLSNPISSTI